MDLKLFFLVTQAWCALSHCQDDVEGSFPGDLSSSTDMPGIATANHFSPGCAGGIQSNHDKDIVTVFAD